MYIYLSIYMQLYVNSVSDVFRCTNEKKDSRSVRYVPTEHCVSGGFDRICKKVSLLEPQA